MIPYKNRFHGHSSLNYIYTHGRTLRSGLLNMRVIKNTRNENSRIAVVVGKKVFKSAVKRNRIRRRVYECIRLNLPQFSGVYDVVFIIHSEETLTIEYSKLKSQVDDLLSKAGVIKHHL